jgi:hypothetical protein
MRGGLSGYQCSTCDADTRAVRRCPRDCADEGEQARLEELRRQLPADPTAPEACLVLWIERPEVLQWFGDAADYRAGHLARAGGIEDQEARWLAAQRVIRGEVDRLDLADAKGGG